jgi:hypothetical protein
MVVLLFVTGFLLHVRCDGCCFPGYWRNVAALKYEDHEGLG